MKKLVKEIKKAMADDIDVDAIRAFASREGARTVFEQAGALLRAAEEGSMEAFELILETGARVDTDALNTAAQYLPEERALETLRFLVDSSDVDINAPDHDGWTPLMHAVAIENMLLTNYLLTRGATDAVVQGDSRNTGYGPGSSIRDIAMTIDEHQIDRGVSGPGQNEPGGFVDVLEDAWGEAEPTSGLEGRWRCIAFRIDDFIVPWREDDDGEGFISFNEDGTFTLNTVFHIEGSWEGLHLQFDDLNFDARLLGGGQSLLIEIPDIDPYMDFGLSECSFWFRRK